MDRDLVVLLVTTSSSCNSSSSSCCCSVEPLNKRASKLAWNWQQQEEELQQRCRWRQSALFRLVGCKHYHLTRFRFEIWRLSNSAQLSSTWYDDEISCDARAVFFVVVVLFVVVIFQIDRSSLLFAKAGSLKFIHFFYLNFFSFSFFFLFRLHFSLARLFWSL